MVNRDDSKGEEKNNGVIPIKNGDKIQGVIESVGRKGDGVFRYEGFVVIVPQTEVGKKYEVLITSVFDKYAFGIKVK